ncbi:MAG TPA: class I SAM-dependent methyltransferase [Thermoleophilaceae bacterium]|nr:class I SAM-dependent methyltransferase [Thermoleophilaceae bacterium]
MSSLRKTLAAPVPEALRRQAWVVSRATAAGRWLRHVPVVAPKDLFPAVDELSITMQHDYEPRGLPYGDAYVLSLVTAAVAPKRIFEIGTGTGRGTLAMLRQAPYAQVDTLDLGTQEAASLGTEEGDHPIEGGLVGEAWRGTSYEESITQHLGDSAAFDFSPFAGQCDLVFVDGAHTFEYALCDSRTALRLIRPGGTIIWDDCHLVHAGVPKALLQLRREGHDVQRLTGSRLAILRTPSPTTQGGS